jgi:hypothetical protein
MSKLTGIELAEQLSDYVNTMSDRGKHAEFIDGFCRQHRTLQQPSFRMILALIEHMASDNYRTDGRNEGSKKVAQKLIKGFEKEYHNELREQGVSEHNIASSVGENYTPSKFLSFI